ncbi:MAG: hypothetical protein WCT31_05650 [Candidatus Micrarchaeia archaeon]|jgi:hypothetical protein
MLPLKDLLNSICEAFGKRNQKKLRKINDQILKQAVIEFNKRWYDLAVVSYVLAKITSKSRYMRKEMDKFMVPIEKQLALICKVDGSASDEEWAKMFADLEKKIKHLEADDPRFITGLMTKGKLKVASILYAQGISLGLAAEMTNMSKQDILDYAGKTMMFDRMKDEQSILDRLKNARKLIPSG